MNKKTKYDIYCEYHPYEDEQIINYNGNKYKLNTFNFAEDLAEFYFYVKARHIYFICPPSFFCKLKKEICASLNLNIEGNSDMRYDYFITNNW